MKTRVCLKYFVNDCSYPNHSKYKAAEIENKIPDARHFINTQEFSKLKETSFDARIKEAVKLRYVKHYIYEI